MPAPGFARINVPLLANALPKYRIVQICKWFSTASSCFAPWERRVASQCRRLSPTTAVLLVCALLFAAYVLLERSDAGARIAPSPIASGGIQPSPTPAQKNSTQSHAQAILQPAPAPEPHDVLDPSEAQVLLQDGLRKAKAAFVGSSSRKPHPHMAQSGGWENPVASAAPRSTIAKPVDKHRTATSIADPNLPPQQRLR